MGSYKGGHNADILHRDTNLCLKSMWIFWKFHNNRPRPFYGMKGKSELLLSIPLNTESVSYLSISSLKQANGSNLDKSKEVTVTRFIENDEYFWENFKCFVKNKMIYIFSRQCKSYQHCESSANNQVWKQHLCTISTLFTTSVYM